MKNLLVLGVLCAAGCAAAKAAPVAGESASSIALTYAVMKNDVAPAPAPLPETKCDGSGYITHGDGHRTPCPGCSACKKAQPLITPAVYTRVTKKQAAASPPEVYTCDCEFHRGSCNCDTIPPGTPVPRKTGTILPASGSCADGSCAAPTKTTTSGSCASGSCGSAQASGPVRNAFKGIRERKPVRKLFGRLFRRG